MCTRPDITNAVCAVSRFSANLSRDHWDAVKHILKYIVGTTGDGLVYGLKECDKLLPDNTTATVNVLIGFVTLTGAVCGILGSLLLLAMGYFWMVGQ